MRLALAMLAAALFAAAGTACSGDDGGEASTTTAEAGATTLTVTTPQGATTTVEVTTTNPSETRPEPPSDQSRWAAQVDDVCRPLQEQIDALPQPTDAASLEAFFAKLVPLVRKQIAGIASLRPPAVKKEARRAKLFEVAYRDLAQALTRYGAALRSADPARIEAAVRASTEAGARLRTYAVSLDVTACGGYDTG